MPAGSNLSLKSWTVGLRPCSNAVAITCLMTGWMVSTTSGTHTSCWSWRSESSRSPIALRTPLTPARLLDSECRCCSRHTEFVGLALGEHGRVEVREHRVMHVRMQHVVRCTGGEAHDMQLAGDGLLGADDSALLNEGGAGDTRRQVLDLRRHGEGWQHRSVRSGILQATYQMAGAVRCSRALSTGSSSTPSSSLVSARLTNSVLVEPSCADLSQQKRAFSKSHLDEAVQHLRVVLVAQSGGQVALAAAHQLHHHIAQIRLGERWACAWTGQGQTVNAATEIGDDASSCAGAALGASGSITSLRR